MARLAGGGRLEALGRFAEAERWHAADVSHQLNARYINEDGFKHNDLCVALFRRAKCLREINSNYDVAGLGREFPSRLQ